jgi:hypothetical protein
MQLTKAKTASCIRAVHVARPAGTLPEKGLRTLPKDRLHSFLTWTPPQTGIPSPAAVTPLVTGFDPPDLFGRLPFHRAMLSRGGCSPLEVVPVSVSAFWKLEFAVPGSKKSWVHVYVLDPGT